MDKQLLSEAEQAKAQAERLIRAIKRGNQGSIKEDADHLYARSKGICEKVFGQKMAKCPNCGAEIMIPEGPSFIVVDSMSHHDYHWQRSSG